MELLLAVVAAGALVVILISAPSVIAQHRRDIAWKRMVRSFHPLAVAMRRLGIATDNAATALREYQKAVLAK